MKRNEQGLRLLFWLCLVVTPVSLCCAAATAEPWKSVFFAGVATITLGLFFASLAWVYFIPTPDHARHAVASARHAADAAEKKSLSKKSSPKKLSPKKAKSGPSFEAFSKRIEQFGLKAKDRGRFWQVVGGAVKVNVSAGDSLSIDSASGAHHNATIDQAIETALEPPPESTKKLTTRMPFLQKTRRYLLDRHPHCHWCNGKLVESTATLEHLQPLSKGGTNSLSNLRLACHNCNHSRGDSEGEPTHLQTKKPK